MPDRRLNNIDARLLSAERSAERELRRMQRTRNQLDRVASAFKKDKTAMPEKSSKYVVIEPLETPIGVVVAGSLLGGLMMISAFMALFAPLDSKGIASTLITSPACYVTSR